MTQQEIQELIQKEYADFLHKKWEGLLPDWFHKAFLKSFMELRQAAVPYRGDQLHSIVSKENNELVFFEVGLVTNILLEVEPKFVAKDVHTFIQRKIALENIRVEFNERQDREQKRLQKKAASLNELTNPRKGQILAKA